MSAAASPKPQVPFDARAERAVLGAVLADGECYLRATEIISDEDFYLKANQRIFEACAKLAEAGLPIDPVLVSDQLKRDGALGDVGGVAYVTQLTNDLPDVPNVEHYALIVREHADRRRVLALGQRLMAAASSNDGDALAEVAAVGDSLASLRSGVRESGAFEQAVAHEVLNLRARAAARRQLAAEGAGTLPEVRLASLADELAIPDEPVHHRINEVLPIGGRVVFSGPQKSGKTTARNNLIRSLADDEPFLDCFAIERLDGHIAIFDTELDGRMGRRWLREQGIRNLGRVVVAWLRGRVGTFDLLDDEIRAGWAQRLRAARISFVILDCLRPVLDALGLSEDKDAGRFLVAFDALLAEAGVSEAVVIHHTGHAGERSRGDSRLRDWPDAEWQLVLEKGEDEGEHQSNARRFFRAYGRDVDVPEGLLEYDPSTRRLSLAGGTRQETAADGLIPALLEQLTETPGLSGRQIEVALVPPHRRVQVRQALQRAIRAGQIRTHPGPKRAVLHSVAETPVRQCAEVRHECAGAQRVSAPVRPIEGAHTLTHSEDPSAPPVHTADREPGDDDETLPGEARL